MSDAPHGDDGADRRGGVLLLHGHGRSGASMAWLSRAARRAGHAASAPNYPSRRPLAEIAAGLIPRLAAFERTFAGPLHIVTHSMGGLVARALIAARRPRRLGRVVMLAPPNAGSTLADLLFRFRLAPLILGASGAHLRTRRNAADELMLGTIDYPVGVIAGDSPLTPLAGRLLPRPHDGKVSLAATYAEGIADHLRLPVSHTLMVHDRRVAAAVLRFLADGRFGEP